MADVYTACISSSLPEEWTFLAEGGAHVVFRYTGQSQSLIGLVLRIAKTRYQHEQCDEVASLLLPSGFMDIPLYFDIGEAFVTRLLEHHVGSRETRRLTASLIAPPGLVSLMPDYHRPKGPGFYSVEIKPKYSCCLPLLDVEPPFDSPQHHILCRFCNHNYAHAEVKSAEMRYCPSLLFSRDSTLVRRAIIALCENPRNNLRLFENGQLMLIPSLEESLITQVVGYICQGPLVRELSRRLDDAWGKVLLAAHYSNKELMQAVVLRDCSMILHDLHINKDLSSIRAHLIDFDPKPGVMHGKYTEEIKELRSRIQTYTSTKDPHTL